MREGLQSTAAPAATLTQHTPRGAARPVPEPALLADALALELKAALEKISLPLAEAAHAFAACRGWFIFGHARLEDHSRERFGRSGQWLRDMAALGDGFSRLRGLAEAFVGDDGGAPLGRVAATQIARVATAESVAAWIALARGSTIRQLKEAVRAARAAGLDRPPARKDVISCAAEPAGQSTPETGGGSSPPRDLGPADEQDRRSVRFLVPRAVKAAFDETLELHRAVSGHEASVTSFVEALVGEALAGPCPPDVEIAALRRTDPRANLEKILARATRNWSRLPGHSPGRPSEEHDDRIRHALEGAARALECADQWEAWAGRGDAVRLDARIRGFLDAEEALQRELGRLLREMADRGTWARLMFNGVGHYAEQRLGMGRTVTLNRARLARSLDRFPRLREAHEAGDVGFEAALLVVRALGRDPADDASERAWIERAAGCTVKRLRDEVRIIHRRQAREPGAAAGRPLDNADWHASLRLDPGTLRERVLGLAASAVRTEARPDVFVRLRLPADLAASFVAAVESRRLQLTRLADSVPWHEPWPDREAPPSLLAARGFSVRCRRAPAWVGLLALLEEYVTVWDDPAAMPRRRSDEVYRRDGWRCAAPGCTSRQHLEDHHVIYRSRRGGDETSNRVCVCRFHHQRGEHGGLASCRGKAPLNVVWRLGRRDVAARYRNERRL